jgi:tryptophanase
MIEPFRIKMVEPIRMTTREERVRLLEAARLNVFALHAQEAKFLQFPIQLHSDMFGHIFIHHLFSGHSIFGFY